MTHEYGEGMSVWIWLPDLADEIAAGGVDPDERGWYPAEVTAVDEPNGVMCLEFRAGQSPKGERVADLMIDLREAAFKIHPYPERPTDRDMLDLMVRIWKELGEPSADELAKLRNYRGR